MLRKERTSGQRKTIEKKKPVKDNVFYDHTKVGSFSFFDCVPFNYTMRNMSDFNKVSWKKPALEFLLLSSGKAN